MKIESVAIICHEANKALCETQGDDSQKPWADAPEWQHESALRAVQFALDNPDVGPAGQHEAWLRDKLNDGWKYGPVKDEAKKEHPCCVAYEHLPLDQQAKDYLFRAIVAGLKPFITSFMDDTRGA